tara:strand:+ start:339 stop:488 length:150 start_codon:yes stop_codon:yes gene_type:complete
MPYFNSLKEKCKYLEEQNIVLKEEIKKLKENVSYKIDELIEEKPMEEIN